MIRAFKYKLFFFIGIGVSLSLLAGCGVTLRLPFAKKESVENVQQSPDSSRSQIKIYGEKEELEFAYAGGMRNVRMAAPKKSEKRPAASYPKKRQRKLTRRDSLYLEMIAKAKKLQEAEKAPHLTENSSPGPAVAPQKSEIKEKVTPPPVKAKPAKKADSYRELLKALVESEKPVEVVIKRGKKYWIGTLVSKMFPFGSSGYEKALDWIVAHNQHYHNKNQLNMVRAGDRLVLPTRKLIEQIQFAQNNGE